MWPLAKLRSFIKSPLSLLYKMGGDWEMRRFFHRILNFAIGSEENNYGKQQVDRTRV
jgi:hypothetical protein